MFPPRDFKSLEYADFSILARCSRLTPAVKNRAQPFRSMHHGKHSASACFFLEVRLSPRIRLQQFARATTRMAQGGCGRGINPLAYRRTPQRELHPSYRTTREMFKGVGWAWTPNGHYPIGRRGVVVQTSPYHTQPCTHRGTESHRLFSYLGKPSVQGP